MIEARDELNDEAKQRFNRKIAVVSGKGGSGKTMVAAEMGRLFGMFHRSILMDADTGTAGMSYYLGLKYVHNITVGVAEFASDRARYPHPPLQKIDWRGDSAFLPMGNHIRLYDQRESIAAALQEIVGMISDPEAVLIVDCRGGIDRESIAVCDAADDVILIVEPDTTAFQATKHVVDVLSAENLAGKLRGFIINKVFEDPSVVARNGASSFRCRCLGAIPFDLDATRDFLVGNIPGLGTQFTTEIWAALSKAYPEVPKPLGRPWSFDEFSRVTLTSPEGLYGGLAATALLIITLMVYASVWALQLPARNQPVIHAQFVFLAIFLGLIGSIDRMRRVLGRLISAYLRVLARAAGGRRE